MFDILSALCAYLSEETGLPTSTEVPAETPDKFLTVYRAGGSRDRVKLDQPTIVVQAWAKTEAEAYELMETVRGLMQGLTKFCDVPDVMESSVRINNPLDGRHKRYEGIWFLLCLYNAYN